jgi:lipase maturation factor 1
MEVASLSPHSVWGLFPRLVGVIYVLAFASLAVQSVELGGKRGVLLADDFFSAIRRDYPGIRRFFDYPTLLWLSSSDRMLRAVPLFGVVCGLAAIYGGPIGYAGLLLGWMLWLSLEQPYSLIFPWDTMLQEVGFLVLFTPLVEPLPSLAPTALPLPSVAFMLRWLPLRLMLGFGIVKFMQATRSDSLYLRGFFVWLPMPNKLSWWGHQAPAWFLKLALYFMFFGEVIAPFLGLFAGWPRLISVASLIGLSLGILATGNWGFFNLGYILLCLPLLDLNASILDLGSPPWAQTWSEWSNVAVHGVMLALFLLTLCYLPNNSWFGRSWVNWPRDGFVWPTERQRKIWLALHRALEPLRWLAPFRIVNSYGVFPPNASPPVRRVPVIEGSADGVTWKQYGYKYMPSTAEDAPVHMAPHHPRLDQGLYYVATGIHCASLTGNVFPWSSPYHAHARSSLLDVLIQRVLAADAATLAMLGHNPFPEAPPKYARVAMIAMTPTRPREMLSTGRWWNVKRLVELTLPRGVASWPDALYYPHPETFSPDFVTLKRRAAPLRAMLAAHDAGMELDLAVIRHSDLTPADVERFWDDLLPTVARQAGDWTQIHTRARQLIERFDIDGLYRMERVLERYIWILHERIAADPAASAVVDALAITHYRYHLILHTVMLEGRDAYLKLLANPSAISAFAQRSDDALQLWAFTMLRYEPVMMHVSIIRQSEAGAISHRSGFPGISEYYPFLSQQASPTETFRPRQEKHADGEFTVEGLYTPPAAARPLGHGAGSLQKERQQLSRREPPAVASAAGRLRRRGRS